jgi:hypothetical protein
LNEAPITRGESWAVLALCAAASLAAIAVSWRLGALLNYGDAVAHLHIARRIFDSRRPGLSQLGSVWLPLPHLLDLPFAADYRLWANGLAGTIPSALAWLAACAGIYRLARRWLGRVEAAIVLAFFATNLNLLYMQTTAMTEPLFICEIIWSVVWLAEWRAVLDPPEADSGDRISPARPGRLLWKIALVLSAAVLTRYDGWIMAFLAWIAVGVTLARRRKLGSGAFWLASALVIAVPIAWFVYNAVVFGDWLTFLRGPYSAQAIEMRTASPGGPPHPGWHDPWVSLLFFLKVAELDAAAASWGNILLAISVFGAAWGLLIARTRAFAWTLLLWLPVPFYAYSVAFGSVPIFIPAWWPHSWYNTRYGLELLPAFAIGIGFAAHFLLTGLRVTKRAWRPFAAGAIFLWIVVNDWRVFAEHPLCYIEGTKNLAARRDYVRDIPPVLRVSLGQHPGGAVLMNTSVFPQLVSLSGIPLRQTINESDREFYSAALAAPAEHAAVVLAFDGDEIAQAVADHPAGLTLVRRFTAPEQPPAALYVSGTPASTTAPAR